MALVLVFGLKYPNHLYVEHMAEVWDNFIKNGLFNRGFSTWDGMGLYVTVANCETFAWYTLQ